jgi:Fe2+ transport system protein FeoA
VHELIPLRQVQAGRTAVIAAVTGDPVRTQRLHDLGLAHGTRCEVVRQGNPCIIRFSGTKLCFRDDETAKVMVFVPAAI